RGVGRVRLQANLDGCGEAYKKRRRPDAPDRVDDDTAQALAGCLIDRIAARHEGVGPVQQVGGRPELWLPSREDEFLRRPLAGERHPCVDTADERGRDRLRVRPVARPLRVEITAVLYTPRHRVAVDEVRAEHFG